MTRKVGDVLIIEREEPQQCDGCGKIAELRPYGKNGSKICCECGDKDPVETEKNMKRIMFGVAE